MKRLLRCVLCGEEIKRGRWRGLAKHVYMYHKEYYGDVTKWIIATTPLESETRPTMDRIEYALLKTGQYILPPAGAEWQGSDAYNR